MKILEAMKHRLFNFYFELLNEAKEDQRPDIRKYTENFNLYSKCVAELYSDLCGDNEEIKAYGSELGEVLKRDVLSMKKQLDVKTALSKLESITWYRGLAELLPVLSEDDLIYLYSKSGHAASTYIDDIEYFYDEINKLKIKYNQRVSE